MNEPLLPYQYEIVFACLQEPLGASELWYHASRFRGDSPQAMAARCRPLIQRGWLEYRDGIYRATDRAREAVSW